MAEDAASGWVLDELEDGKPVPAASRLQDVHPNDPDGFVSLITLDMDACGKNFTIDPAVRLTGGDREMEG